MANMINTGTGNIPLSLAASITRTVNALWDNGELLSSVAPISTELLKYWFCEPHTHRATNFHEGQRQAILNTVYLQEILQIKSVFELYEKAATHLLTPPQFDISMLSRPKYQIPKYAVKMATGTGKTWVMNATVIWQYLNAKAEDEPSGKFSQNFLLVAPGLIVYERLLDSYLGKENRDGERDFKTSDIYKNRELFLPEHYRDAIFGFLQSSVVKKEDIGRKITGGGMIAVSNWHLFMDRDEEVEDESVSGALKDIFPIRPGTSGGNSLESLDASFLGGGAVEYLANMDSLIVINDEAHHIHENKTAGIVEEVEWQKALDKIAIGKGSRFVQFDFSATPYDIAGSGQNRTKHYFPHTIVNFGLDTAIKNGLVKMIAIDKRDEWATSELDFRAIRDDANKVIGISDGQKLMIGAGLQKLKILENSFVKVSNDKRPKMLVMCEDTTVVPFVEEYLREIGLSDDEYVGIHSNKKGELKIEEWQSLKQKVFNIDALEKPKVIISVLMLREGFDVSNICVIVPLRSSQAPILLEQTIGRGLRLMWREPELVSLKSENRERLLQKLEPLNYLDLLSIIEHPAFIKFYADLEELLGGALPQIDGGKEGGSVTGDIVNVGLKDEYEKYDLYWPKIARDEEEILADFVFDGSKLSTLTLYSLEELKSFTPKGESFHSEEITTETVFGKYQVGADFFKAASYNEYLQKLLTVITNKLDRLSPRGHFKPLPNMQINLPKIMGIIDGYIRNKLFGEPFDPFADENWRILLLKTGGVSEHIIREISKLIYESQQNTLTSDAQIEKIYFSKIDKLTVRENYSLKLTKTIYERTAYPSNKGEFEKDFLLFLDKQSGVDAFIKIIEFKHIFASVPYIRADGLMAHYSPDFLVRTAEKIYIVETKADKDIADANVKQKRKATLAFVDQINHIAPQNRDSRKWEYLLLSDARFYMLSKNGADFEDIVKVATFTKEMDSGMLF